MPPLKDVPSFMVMYYTMKGNGLLVVTAVLAVFIFREKDHGSI